MKATYQERLWVPLRWWAQATMLVATAWLALLVAVPGWVTTLVTALIVALTAALLMWIGSARIEVSPTHVRAGSARLPVQFVASATALDAAATRRRMGPGADARAWLVTRPYLAESVEITLQDPADPTPYWLVSTRRPQDLVAAIEAARGTHAAR